ncbi:MAG: Wsc4p [Parcubacteria group bacterium Athens1014_10]|nr:MAG: Wsc4p [Parcubacteria group bacterium Athens1014_10]TSD04473.1 MAG: Wsc4p [Parcubacteria group bacterium Athens0714_12]
MRKNIFLMMLLFLLAVSFIALLPKPILAANDFTFSQETYISMTDPATTINISSGSAINSMTVGISTINLTIDSGGSIILTSPSSKLMTTNPNIATVQCGTTNSSITLTSSTVVTVLNDSCSISSGGSGAGSNAIITTPTTTSTPTVIPTTTTGEVTATAAAGGKTTITTIENTTAAVEIPVSAISANTEVKIYPVEKSALAENFLSLSGKEIIGDYVYNFTAAANGSEVANFLKPVTLTFTYNNSQVSDFNESNLKVYYWDSASDKWVVVPSGVNTLENKISVAVDHFTYFAIMGEKTTTCGIANKSLVKASGQSALYWIYGGKRHVFPHSAVYHSWGLPSDFSTVKTVSTYDLNVCSEGDVVSFRDGSMFRGTAKSVYGKDASAVFFVSDNKLRAIKSGEIYQKLFNDQKWTRVTWVPDDLLSKFAYPLGDLIDSSMSRPNGCIVKYADFSAIYLIENGKKRGFKSWDNFLNNGYKKSLIITIPKIENYTDGEMISSLVESINLPK